MSRASNAEFDLQQLALVAEIAPVAITYLDREQRYRYANRTYLAWLGVTWDEIRDRPIREVVGEEAYLSFKDRIEDGLAGHAVTYERSIVFRQLGKRYLRAAYAPDIDENGQVRGLVAALHDLTPVVLAQKRQEVHYEVTQVFGAALTLAGATSVLKLLGQLLGAEIVQLWTPDPGGESVRCASVWHARESAFTQWAAKCGQIQLGRGADLVGRAWATGEPVEIADLSARPDLPRAGDFAAANLHAAIATPIIFRNVVVGVLEILSTQTIAPADDTRLLLAGVANHYGQFMERLRLEERLRENQKMEAVGRLAGGIAHDFNNLLAVVMGHAELMRADLVRAPDVVQQGEALHEILDATNRAVHLTRQLLAFGRKQMIRTTILDPGAIVQQQLPRLTAEMPDNVKVVLKSAPGLGHVRGDADLIAEILKSLCTNAREAMPGGGDLTIQLENVTLDEGHTRELAGAVPGPYVLMAISDTGRGMELETQRRIFEPFFSTRGPAEKRGLGLAVVYGIVKQSGGHIWVYSEPGKGTTFKTYFPRVDPLPQEPVAAPRPPPAARGWETVLIVEDDRHLRRVAAHILRDNGYNVVEAKDAEQALEISAEGEPIHLVLSDVTMPGIKGPELLRKLRTTRPDLRAILMSGYTEDVVHQQGMLDENVPFISKPFSVADLLAKVRATLGPL